MKKIIFIAALLLVLVGINGCEKAAPTTDLNMDESAVKLAVKGWTVYTNPAYRWEVRVPKSWSYADSGENGYQADFFAKSGGSATVEILSKSNWQENYTLEQFYEKQTVNIWKDYKGEDMTLGGNPATLFREVKGLVPNSDQTAQVIAIRIEERIVQIIIFNVTDDSKTLVNSIKFYGGAGKLIE